MSAATLSICSSQSSKGCRSLALEIGMSFMKCQFSWEVDDLIMFCKASVISQWRCWVLCVCSAWHQNSLAIDWLKSNGVGFGLYWFTYVWGDVDVSCGIFEWYASLLWCCVTGKSSVYQDTVRFVSFDEFDTQFDVKVLGPLGEIAPVGVLSWGLARACEIVSCVNLLVFCCAIVHTWMILCRSPDTLFVKFHSSYIIMLIVVGWLWIGHETILTVVN